jgi:hypothetical protein
VDFDTKIAIVLDEQLAVWQKANVTAFLISGIVATGPTLVAEPYIDGTGNRYLPMCRQTILIYAADRSGLRRAYERAMARIVASLPQPSDVATEIDHLQVVCMGGTGLEPVTPSLSSWCSPN